MEALFSWSTQKLAEAGLLPGDAARDNHGEISAERGQWSVVSGDASFRCYYRFSSGSQSWIAVTAPPETEKNREFVAIASVLGKQGLMVPQVLGVDYDQGFLLLNDLGDSLMLPALAPETVDSLYSRAMSSLLLLQQTPTTLELQSGLPLFPAYDRKRLLDEMLLFPQWFIKELLGYTLTDSESGLLAKVFEQLVSSAIEQPQVCVHRDFHSRNLMLVELESAGNSNKAVELGIIDFQDAVTGPVTYDLVSLLRDCYIVWPPTQVSQWALQYLNRLVEAGMMQPVSDEQFLEWFDLMGLQRHLKVLGIFARLSLRDGKDAYLDDLPLVIHYTLSVAANYPALDEFTQWFEAKLLPLAREADWYREIG